MVLKANRKILLSAKRKRILRRELVCLCRLCAIQIASGLDPGYAWGRAVEEWANPNLPEHWRELILAGPFRSTEKSPEEFEGLADIRTWFRLLNELYAAGAAVLAPLESFADGQESVLDTELQGFVDRLRVKSQIAFLIFFAPGAFFILLFPWLYAL